MAFRISRGVWQFKKADGSYESKYKLNDSGSLVETDASGNEVSGFNASVAWTAVSGRPTTLSSFTNDLGNYGGWLTTSGKAADANLLDGIDSSSFLRTSGGTVSGVLYVSSTNDAQLQLRSNDSWTGIGFDDSSSNGADYIWHWGATGTFAIGGGGSTVSGKRLHVHGGTSIGSGLSGISVPTDGLYVQGDVQVGGSITVNKSGTDSYINFPAQSNDPGYIRHYESSNTARMFFSVSDDAGTNDYFAFGYSGDPDNFRIYSDGSIYSPLGAEFDGRVYADNGLHVRGDWVRVNGTTGIYFESYGGGWHMSDSTWIRSYNSKPIYVDQYVRADQGFEVSGHRVIGNDRNVNAYSKVQIGNFTIQQNAAGDLEFLF